MNSEKKKKVYTAIANIKLHSTNHGSSNLLELDGSGHAELYGRPTSAVQAFDSERWQNRSKEKEREEEREKDEGWEGKEMKRPAVAC